MNRRRVTLQLTPLLDMLLIIIFAQYLEVKTTVARDRAETLQQVQDRTREVHQLEARVQSLRTQLAELELANTGASTLRTDFESLRGRVTELQQALELAVSQRESIGKIAAELFRLPPSILEKALQPGAEKPLSEADLESIRKLVNALAENRAGEVTRHLLTYSELRKRSDVWDLWLDDGGQTVMDTGERTERFRAGTADAFQRELFDRYKSAPQPKGLVIILLSWGNTPAKWREAAINGLRQAAERMRDDSGGRTRFEYAILGFRPRE